MPRLNSAIVLESPTSRALTSTTCTISKPSGVDIQRLRAWSMDATEERFTNSFGAQLSNLDGKNRWTPVGLAETLWKDEVVPRIDDLLAEKKEKIYKNDRVMDASIIRHCWMMGRDRAHAWPTVVLCCNLEGMLRRTADVIKKDKRVAELGFRLLGVLTRDLRLLKMTEGLFVRLPYNNLGKKPWSLCGRRIFTNESESASQATIGGVIVVDEMCFGLTAAHAFFNTSIPVESAAEAPPEFFDYDLDISSDKDSLSSDNKEEEEETSQDLIRGNQNGSPAARSMLPTDAANKEISGPLADDESVSLRVSSIVSPEVPNDINDPMFSGGDWALIALDEPECYSVNVVSVDTSDQPYNLFIQSLARVAPSGKVLVPKCDATISGTVAGSTCSIKLRGSEIYCKVWPVELDRASCLGDSGAWVLDAATGDLHGVLFAECSSLNMNYMIPLETIVQSIKDRTSSEEVRLPTLLESLRITVEYNNKEMFQRLVDAGTCETLLGEKVSQVQIDDYTEVLIWAAGNGLIHEVSELLEAYTFSMRHDNDLLARASGRLLAAAAGVSPPAETHRSRTVPRATAEGRHLDVVGKLLAPGVRLDRSKICQVPYDLKDGEEHEGVCEAKKYLKYYGYAASDAFTVDNKLDSETRKAISQFQEWFELDQTGQLDGPTKAAMTQTRCAHRDGNLLIFGIIGPWHKRDLKYMFGSTTLDLDPNVCRAAVQRAFQTWADAGVSLTFTEVSNIYEADICIDWRNAADPDLASLDPEMMMGPTLAHADFPPGHSIIAKEREPLPLHFDDSEHVWVDGAVPNGYDIETVALHEIGHCLGMLHSNVRGAVMFPTLSDNNLARRLRHEDIQGIRALYL